ncbi:hypothetical protein AB0F13_00260 [Streptomyces sp. NPDC026206]|uniref:hypothetical protein n=1 Tax=Streptomyces sp. NPDC026206 TaxID=3157089 RepID=UPI0033C4A51D
MSLPRVAVGTVAVDTFTGAVGTVTESADGLVRLQYPNGYSWQAYATNLRPPGPAERHRLVAAERAWSPVTVTGTD